MPIKNPFKKTFAQKRKALGVTRSLAMEATKKPVVSVSKHGQINSIHANPKIRKIETTSLKKLNELDNKLLKLAAFKPKNEMEARKRDEAVYLIKEKIRNTEYAKTNALNVVSKERRQEREKRQEKLIFKKLFSIVSKSAAFKKDSNMVFRNKILNSKYDLVLLRKNYQNLLITSKKRFVDVTSKEAIDLLERSIVSESSNKVSSGKVGFNPFLP
jgi:hypothetical protein